MTTCSAPAHSRSASTSAAHWACEYGGTPSLRPQPRASKTRTWNTSDNGPNVAFGSASDPMPPPPWWAMSRGAPCGPSSSTSRSAPFTSTRTSSSIRSVERSGDGRGGAGGVDPTQDDPFEHRQGYRTVRQDGAVEGAYVEGVPEPALSEPPEPDDLASADHVGEGLSRPGDVTVDLVDDVVPGGRGVLPHEVHGAVARPAEGVQARVDDQPAGAQGVEREHAQPVQLRAVQAHLVGEPLAVQAPPLDVRAHLGVQEPAVQRQGPPRLRGRDLQVVPRGA